MIRRHWVAVLLIVAALAVGGYNAYRYIKFNPPDWLIALVTHRAGAPAPLPTGDVAPLVVPEGFAATIFARDIKGARVMTRDPKGTILVSQTSEGAVVALPNFDTDGKADRVVTVLDNLKQPHGIVIVCPETGFESARQDACLLYVAETHSVKEYAYDADTFTAKIQKEIASLPSGDGHYTRTLMLHPDGKRLLVSIGSSCNVCEENDPRRASIQQIDLTTGVMTPFATGLRNTVFMTTHYVTGDIWGTDMGRDLLGDDVPPEEVNIIREGKDYGWPICYGNNIHDTDFDSRQYIRNPCTDKMPPQIEMQAHSAPLGIVFVPEEGWPEEWWYDALIAYHGSWNRSLPTGYKVVRYPLDAKGKVEGGPHDFITGFAQAGEDYRDAIGRPVDIMIEPGGTIYISDDRAGAVYRIARK